MTENIFLFSNEYTLDDANLIIVILAVVVIALIVTGYYIIRQNRHIRQRNEQLQRILTALDEYRAIVGNQVVSSDIQVNDLKEKLQPNAMSKRQENGSLSFFVMMDARINKEKPFVDPDFNQEALLKFMGVSYEQFCELVPRYKEPERTLDYINSLRAEHAAKLLMEHPDCTAGEIIAKCGFRDTASYTNAFKFSFGIMPTEFVYGVGQMFKKKKTQ